MDEVARESASEEGPPTPAVCSLRAAGCSWASGPGPPWGLRPLGPPGHLGRVPALAKAAVMSSVPTSLPSSVSAEPSYREAKRPSSARLPRASLPPVAPEEHPGRALVSTPGPCPGPALPCTALHTSPRLTPSRLWSAVPSPLCLVNTDSSLITDAAGLPCTSAHPAPGAALTLAVRGQGH